MKVYADYFDAFSCSGSDCIRNCCTGWKINLDDATVAYYRSLDDEYGRQIQSRIIQTESGNYCFSLAEGERCIGQNEQGLCKIFIEYGENRMSEVCRQFPRVDLLSNLNWKSKFLVIQNQCEALLQVLYDKTNLIEVEFENRIVRNGEDELILEMGQYANYGLRLIQNTRISIPCALSTVLYVSKEAIPYLREGNWDRFRAVIDSSDSILNEFEGAIGSMTESEILNSSHKMIGDILGVFYEVMEKSGKTKTVDIIPSKEQIELTYKDASVWKERIDKGYELLFNKREVFLRRFMANCFLYYSLSILSSNTEEYLINRFAPIVLMSCVLPTFWESEKVGGQREFFSRLSQLQRVLQSEAGLRFFEQVRNKVNPDEVSYALIFAGIVL